MPPPDRSVRVARAASVLLLCGLLPGVLPGGTSPASASSEYLCTGYRPCAKAGLSHHGYAGANDTMYWRMYTGHNCTNYVAYRLIEAGMSTERPWSSTGMAYNWGHAMKPITDEVPAVGAVAWWDRGVSGAGSDGHVAIVEQIVSDTEIIISEDSWSGDFHWRRIVKDGTSWPTGFIHFVDQSVTNTVAPEITGTPQVGATLRTTTGRWTPGATYAFQWLADGTPVAGATAQTFVPGPEQVGQTISVRVTASREDYTPGVAVAATTAPVAKGELVNTTPPTVSGDGEVDAVLVAAPGMWSAVPDRTVFRWRSDGAVIRGVTDDQLTLTQDMVGTTITAVEIARRAGFVNGTAAAPQAVGPVVEGTIEVTTPFSASGRNSYGAALTLIPGTTDPADVSVAYSWLRDGAVIAGASGATYQLTVDDVGHTIAARITLTKPGYAPLVRNYAFARTTTPSTVTVLGTGHKLKAAVRVRVVAPGTTPTGQVTFRAGGGTTTVDLVDGQARVVLDGLKAGDRTIKAVYAGDEVAERASAAAHVVVKRPRKPHGPGRRS